MSTFAARAEVTSPQRTVPAARPPVRGALSAEPAGHRPENAAVQNVRGILAASPHVHQLTQQKALLNGSPRVVAQRQRAGCTVPGGAVVQRQQLGVYRKLPLTQSLNWQKPDVAKMGIKEALRAKYPATAPKTDADPEGRGPGYVAELANHLKQIDADAAGRSHEADLGVGGHARDKIAVFAPHVAGVQTKPRDRANSSQAEGINKLDKRAGGPANYWLGAHLVKREWGGEDNVWNVVAWPQETEDRWADAVEAPIDHSFLLGDVEDAILEITVTKEDEVWPAAAISSAIDARLNSTAVFAEVEGEDAVKAESRKKVRSHVAGVAEKARLEANAAVERVPQTVRAACGPKPSVAFAMNQSDTHWPRARMVSFEGIVASIDANITQAEVTLGAAAATKENRAYHPSALGRSKTRTDVTMEELAARAKERQKAHDVEKKNLAATTDELDPTLL